MIRRPPRSTLFPTRRSSDLAGGKSRGCRRRPRAARFEPHESGWSAAHDAVRIVRRCCRTAGDRKSTRLNSSHDQISYAVFCLKKKKEKILSGKPHISILQLK